MYDPGHCIHIDNLHRMYYHTTTVLQPRGKTPAIFLYYYGSCGVVGTVVLKADSIMEVFKASVITVNREGLVKTLGGTVSVRRSVNVRLD